MMTRRDYHPRLQALLLAVVMLVVPCGSATAASGGWKVVRTVQHSPRLVFRAASAVPGSNVVWIAGAAYPTAPVVFERWSAGQWTAFSAPTTASLADVAGMDAAGPGDLWAVGSSASATGRRGHSPSTGTASAGRWSPFRARPPGAGWRT